MSSLIINPYLDLSNPQILNDYNIELINKVYYDEYDIEFDYKYQIYLGNGRRGQTYKLLFNDKEIYLYSTPPDGSGCESMLTELLYKLIKDNIIIPSSSIDPILD